MDAERWYKYDIKEQMSNIHGEVVRLVRARNNYLSGKTSEDHTESYMDKIDRLINMTCEDPKNHGRERELISEENEIRRWLSGETDDRYILRYWEQYPNAIS